MRKVLVAALAAVALLGACTSTDEGHGGGHSAAGQADDGHDHVHAASGTIPGAPADASDATRTIEISATDQLRFDPDEIEVEQGEVVTFVVTNEGDTDHEFVLGDREYQEGHESEMAGGGHMGDTGNAVALPPGETAEITWEFSEAGEVVFACHVAGHYAGGMEGTITVR